MITSIIGAVPWSSGRVLDLGSESKSSVLACSMCPWEMHFKPQCVSRPRREMGRFVSRGVMLRVCGCILIRKPRRIFRWICGWYRSYDWESYLSKSAEQSSESGPQFNIKMSSYQYRKSHCGDKTVVRSSYLHNGISYTGKMWSLYWIRAQVIYFTFIRCEKQLLIDSQTSTVQPLKFGNGKQFDFTLYRTYGYLVPMLELGD